MAPPCVAIGLQLVFLNHGAQSEQETEADTNETSNDAPLAARSPSPDPPPPPDDSSLCSDLKYVRDLSSLASLPQILRLTRRTLIPTEIISHCGSTELEGAYTTKVKAPTPFVNFLLIGTSGKLTQL